MTHQEMVSQIKTLDFFEIRNDEAERFEAVIRTDKLSQAAAILDGFYGSAYKSAKAAVTAEAKKITAPYGGIMDNQTLYFKKDGFSSIAMIWPWGNGQMATLFVLQGA